jgi:hypothetical protein
VKDEPRHYRYVGKKAAKEICSKEICSKGICSEEYLQRLNEGMFQYAVSVKWAFGISRRQ